LLADRTERPVRRDGVLARRVDDVLVLLDPETGQYFQLNGVGADVWELCDGNVTIDEIVTTLERRYNVARSTVLEDVQALVDSLIEENLLSAG
jgi:hypothetical protein